MKRCILKYTNIIISLIILMGFFIISFANYYTYSKIIKDDIENITKLTSSNIYSEINNELTKPIFVSLTMANDTFLKNWLHEEKKYIDDASHIQKLHCYLEELQKKYTYNSVFLVSADSDFYYHYEGIHKKISQKNAHDIWYYTFLKSNKAYDLDVDVDEADNNTLTVFVNCRIEDPDGTLLGVVGVGVKMRQLQSRLEYFEKNFNLAAFLINPDGLVQVHTNENMIENAQFSNLLPEGRNRRDLPHPDEGQSIEWYASGNQENCLIIRYISQLEWYLVVDKDTSVLRRSFIALLFHDSLIVAVVIIALLALSSRIITSYKKIMTKLATTDELSGLTNRRAFMDVLQKCGKRRRAHDKKSVMFIFDIDYFKKINDTQGHLYGDALIRKIGQLARELVGDAGVVARWGGDEFVGILYEDGAASEEIISRLREAVHTQEEFREHSISISVGATRITPADTPDSLIARADRGLYAAKSQGRNRVTWC